ncbi:MAG TPA: TIGR03618 family F420-dependent PPOX class oxidoreductase [Acidimicrobiales bacterium]|nr:TIGR03618 family F420-dependent PPOX class oxidoreductase [Acidimicrobiales bacterium]
MSRRDLIKMTPAEIDEFLAGRHTMNVATIGPDGRPHLVAMWYGFFADGAPGFWTYGKSQKIRNLERDPRLTCLVETGAEYAELKGVEIVATGTVLTDRDAVMEIGRSVFERYTGPWTDAAAPAVEQMGAKRSAVRIEIEKLVTWDHSKLGGTY